MPAPGLAARPAALLAPFAVAALAVLMFTGMDAVVKAMPTHLSTLQIVALRFSFGIVPATLMLWRAGARPTPSAWRANGLRGYLKETFVANPAYMTPLMTPIHIVSELSRIISLSMRLFGNVFAGEVLLATMIALAPILIPAVFLGLEALFGFVQALVFALLAMTYIGTAIAEHHSSGHDDHGEADEAHAPHPAAADAASA